MMDVLNGYRDSHDISSDDDSEDSDKECTVWKRAPVKKTCKDEILAKIEEEELKKEPPVLQAKPERKRNTIWCEVLQDQLISEDLEDCLLKNKPHDYGSRGKESYDYTLRYDETRSERDSDCHGKESYDCTLRYDESRSEIDSDCHMSDSALNEESPKSKIKHSSSFHNNVKKFVKLDSAELTAARKINKVLNEKKFYLIQRIVKTVGIEKSMDLLSMTEEIEDNGGMMINSNKRRRTPGGVYIQLLKNDKNVTQEMLDKIFEGEMSGIELKRYYAEQKKNRKKKKFLEKRRNKRKSNGLKEILEIGEKAQESGEIVPMDAEITTDMDSEKPSLDNGPSSVPAFNKNTSENNSDLEEGEIED